MLVLGWKWDYQTKQAEKKGERATHKQPPCVSKQTQYYKTDCRVTPDAVLSIGFPSISGSFQNQVFLEKTKPPTLDTKNQWVGSRLAQMFFGRRKCLCFAGSNVRIVECTPV